MKHHLEDCSLRELVAMHRSLKLMISVAGGEENRPVHFDKPSGVYLAAIIDWMAERLDEVERAVERLPVASYEDAIQHFNIRTDALYDAAPHYAEVLKLLAHAQDEAA